MDRSNGLPIFLTIMNIVNSITHFLIGGVTVVTVIFAYNTVGSDHFRQHIILCVIGYVLLMGEAILSYNKHNGWSLTLNHKEKKTAHLILQIVGSALAIAGSIIRIQGYGGTHFSTAHGITGWLAFILTTVSFIGGLFNYFVKSNKISKIGHGLIGCVTITLAFITLCLGLNMIVFRSTHSDSAAILMISFTAMALVGILSKACPDTISRMFR